MQNTASASYQRCSEVSQGTVGALELTSEKAGIRFIAKELRRSWSEVADVKQRQQSNEANNALSKFHVDNPSLIQSIAVQRELPKLS
jgi:hypothetical protein